MNHRKLLQKLIAVFLLLIMSISFTVPDSVVAEKNTAIAEARDKAKQAKKSEIVYASLDNTGNTKDVYIVSHYPAATDSDLIDYGDYTEVEDLALSGTASLAEEQVNIHKVEKDFYYKGKTKRKELPWQLQIDYLLDGVPLPAEDLADSAGNLEIRLEIAPNSKLAKDNVWARSMLLQISVTLANDVAQNISSENGIVAEAGSNTIVTFMMLPGQESETERKIFKVFADVDHFSMPSIQIAANPFSLSMFQFDMPDLSANEEVEKFREATKTLADGTDELTKGLASLQDGKNELAKNLNLLTASGKELTDGAGTLQNGISEYVQGVEKLTLHNHELLQSADLLRQSADQMLSGFKILTADGELLKGSEEVKAGLAAISEAAGQLTPAKISAMKDSLAALPDQVEAFSTELQAFFSGIGTLKSNLDDLISGLTDLQSALTRESILGSLGISAEQIKDNDVSQQILGYVEGVSAQSLPAITGGLSQISLNLSALQNSSVISEMQKSLADLEQLSQISGLLDMLSGLQQLAAQYSLLHSGLYEYVNGFQRLHAGYYQEDPQKPSFYQGLTAYLEGIKEYLNGASLLSANGSNIRDGLVDYTAGTSAYVNGFQQWADGFLPFSSAIDELKSGSSELSGGMTEFAEGTAEMDQLINQMITSYLSDYEQVESIPSFASDKNAFPAQVQFVLMTEAIVIEDENVSNSEPLPEKTLWDRIADLFK